MQILKLCSCIAFKYKRRTLMCCAWQFYIAQFRPNICKKKIDKITNFEYVGHQETRAFSWYGTDDSSLSISRLERTTHKRHQCYMVESSFVHLDKINIKYQITLDFELTLKNGIR